MFPVEAGFAPAGALNDSDARLIWELVANISPAADVLKRHGLTVADFAAKKRDTMFVAAFKEAKAVWNSDMNVQQRIKFKSGLLLEDSLQDLFLIIKNPEMAASLKMEATKQLGQLSQTINPKQSAESGGSAFKLTINLGDSPAKTVTIDGYAVSQQSLPADAG